MKNSIGGMILLDKPSGITSFNALNSIKRKLDTRKVGHTGTLDKFASGLIVALSGKMTKLVPEFTGLDKEYEALIRFGAETETLDPEGDVIYEAEVPEINEITKAIQQFSGKIKQTPPAYSAVHINGKRAYERVRSGEEVIMPERDVEIYRLNILSWESPFLRISVHCSKGTYIRSLARDLGIAAGSRAYLTELKRISVGPFRLDSATEADAFDEKENLISPNEIFDYMPDIGKLTVSDDLVPLIRSGKEIVFQLLKTETEKTGEYALFDSNMNMLAMLISDGGKVSYRFVC
ncbi:tRNA pseudouridine(55) synthase TruB [Spirochaeta isovalerica]|uniref:tRNA pseudouridine synthase B n=1 Tax=Spirochaeta isovalerica TaxID=150 RepID=A0A841R4M5_9SPIO|nr:tRNA pseudouridine(55) synthase TruB [Spirochaeta isovalerica]MBB6478815.1 tRNA pseudouridine55 synthase [Spirochaeta isovalerica]